MRRLGHILAIALITAGLVVLADVGLTLAYKEPVSSIYGEIQQDQAADQLSELEANYPTPADRRAMRGVSGLRARASILARRFGRQIDSGRRDRADHRPRHGRPQRGRRPGHRHRQPAQGARALPTDSPFPGERGTVGIAGHRTTYLAPFRHIDSMKRGDPVTLEMPYATFVYRVQKTDIVDPGDVGVVRPVGYERLVLSACHPLYSAAQRYIVFARLSRIAPAPTATARAPRPLRCPPRLRRRRSRRCGGRRRVVVGVVVGVVVVVGAVAVVACVVWSSARWSWSARWSSTAVGVVAVVLTTAAIIAGDHDHGDDQPDDHRDQARRPAAACCRAGARLRRPCASSPSPAPIIRVGSSCTSVLRAEDRVDHLRGVLDAKLVAKAGLDLSATRSRDRHLGDKQPCPHRAWRRSSRASPPSAGPRLQVGQLRARSGGLLLRSAGLRDLRGSAGASA